MMRSARDRLRLTPRDLSPELFFSHTRSPARDGERSMPLHLRVGGRAFAPQTPNGPLILRVSSTPAATNTTCLRARYSL